MKITAQSADWRAYRILELRYIEGLSPAEVMQQLAFGRSYYFREQARILEALTSMLWDQRQQILDQIRQSFGPGLYAWLGGAALLFLVSLFDPGRAAR